MLKPQDGTMRVIKADLYSICFSGAGVYAPERIEPGINIKIELKTELSDQPLIGEGEIVHAYEIKRDNVSAFRMGIKFINTDNKKLQHLLYLIQQDMMKARNKR